MGTLGQPTRWLVTLPLIVALSLVGFCPCPSTPAPCTPSKPLAKCCCGCGQTAVSGGCGMACCQKQTPTRDDRTLPNGADREQSQLVLMLVLPVTAIDDGSAHSSPLAAFLASLESRLAPATLQSQHICMQV